jgi:hypothetical protein
MPQSLDGLPATKPTPRQRFERLLAKTVDAGLNLLGILRELYQGYQRSNTFFKYRVLVVASWAVLSLGGVAAAFHNGAAESNALGARMVVSSVADEPVYMIVNESNDAWQDVRLVVNERFSAAAIRVAPGGELTIGIRKLIDETGRPAPENLHVDKMTLKTSDDSVDLVREGRYRFSKE